MARRTNRTNRTKSPRNTADPTALLERMDRAIESHPGHRPADPIESLLRQHRLSRLPHPPEALTSYALGAQRTSMIHVTSEDKARFEALRSELRSALAFPVTQLGAFAALVTLAERDREAFVALARSAG